MQDHSNRRIDTGQPVSRSPSEVHRHWGVAVKLAPVRELYAAAAILGWGAPAPT